MTSSITNYIYILSGALFILSLKWMNTPVTARRGVIVGSAGLIAFVTGVTVTRHAASAQDQTRDRDQTRDPTADQDQTQDRDVLRDRDRDRDMTHDSLGTGLGGGGPSGPGSGTGGGGRGGR